MQQSTRIVLISYIAIMIGAFIYMFVIPSNSLDPEPNVNDYDGALDPMLAGDSKPVDIKWGGVTVSVMDQIPQDTTTFSQDSQGRTLTVGINKNTSDGNHNSTDRPRAELSIQDGSSVIKSTSYNIQIDGKSADNKTAHVTQIKSAAKSGMPLLTVSVGNPKGNTNDYGYLSVMKGGKAQWINKDGGLSTTFDPKKAIPANKTNRVEIDFTSKNNATLKVNGNDVTSVSNVDNGLLKFGAYAGSSKLDNTGIKAIFTNIQATAR
jgi:hypothetical protein